MGLLQFLVALVAIWCALVILSVVLAWLRLLKLELRARSSRPVDPSEVPAGLRDFLEAGAPMLEELGFRRVGFSAYLALEDSPELPERFSLAFEHPDLGVWASLAPSALLDASMPFSVGFRAWFDDGTSLLGVNGLRWATLGDTPGVELLDPYAATVALQWSDYRTHLEARAQSSAVRRLSLAEATAEDRRYKEAHLEALERARVLTVGASGARVLRTWPALEVAIRVQLGARRYRRLVRARAQNPVSVPAIPIEIEVDRYLRSEALRKKRTPRERYGVIFTLTGIAFAASMFHFFDASTVALVVGVLFLHELGHFLAMRAFGYVDTTIFFVPFFGAATVGEKADRSLGEEMVVLLAGPIPGIVLAALLSLLAPELESLREARLMLFAINWVNLLPFYPLDGGKVVDLLLFSRVPWAAAAFRALAVLVFLWLGIRVESLLLILGILGGLAVRNDYRVARLNRDVQAQHQAQQGSAPLDLVLVFERLRALGYGRFSIALRHLMVRTVARNAGMPAVGAGRRAALLSAYVFLVGAASASGSLAVGRSISGRPSRARSEAESSPKGLRVDTPARDTSVFPSD
jgi:Zn-dependent protease